MYVNMDWFQQLCTSRRVDGMCTGCDRVPCFFRFSFVASVIHIIKSPIHPHVILGAVNVSVCGDGSDPASASLSSVDGACTVCDVVPQFGFLSGAFVMHCL